MAQKSRRRFQKPVRRTRRHSTAGKILPPLDVRKPHHLKEFERRIKKGPVTIVLVYADWCGHCHTMMPHFDAASKSPSRSIQSVKLNETMLNSTNDFMKKNINSNAKPISVDGYPSIILVDNKGNKISDVETVRDTNTMTKVMSNAGPLAESAGIGEEPMPELEPVESMRANSMRANSMRANSMQPASMRVSMNKSIRNGKAPSASTELDVNPLSKSKSLNVTGNIDKETELMLSSAPIRESLNTEASIVTPEAENTDLIGEGEAKVGGSLLSALARTSYKLAPTAALLATAAYVMKGRRSSKRISKRSSKRSSKRRGTVKRGKKLQRRATRR